MKKMIAAALLAASSAAMAAGGQFDGVYQNTINNQVFYSLHQNGNTLLMTTYTGTPTDGGVFFWYGGVRLFPPAIYQWEVQVGQIIGNRAVLTGGTFMNACNVTIQLDMAPGFVTGRILSSSQTQLGATQGIPCGLLLPAGFTTQATRMF
jgi:hypothetical protein